MKKIIVPALLLLLAANMVFAQRKITIKVASPIPANSPWGRYLNQIASDWKKITNGEVDMIIYHDGVAGKEKEVVRLLKSKQYQAAVLSTFGLYEISPEIMTLSCPFLIRDDDELDIVLDDLKDDLEDGFSKQGYFTLAWARVGWVKFFSKAPIYTPSDLKKQKLGTIADQSEMNQVFRTMGFRMVPVERDDILVALNSNTVDTVFQSPVAVGSAQIFGLAKNMASINVAPFTGAVLIDRDVWRRIPDKYKPLLLETVRKNEAELDREVRKFESDMVNIMGSYGLNINQLSPVQEQLWYDEIGQVMPKLVGTLFDRKVYERAGTILKNYRNGRR
jgi:TRAP-type C4-dicarboxylate transport system substrate-binding protein